MLEVCRGGVVAERPCLLQTYVAEWLPKSVTNPVFLIRRHLYMPASMHVCIMYRIYTHIDIDIHIHIFRHEKKSIGRVFN